MVISATDIIINNGIAASLVYRPIKTKMPHAISNVPTSGARKWGLGKPILAKRPDPNVSANKNFCIPSERNTVPTIRRMIKVVFELSVYSIRSRIFFALTQNYYCLRIGTIMPSITGHEVNFRKIVGQLKRVWKNVSPSCSCVLVRKCIPHVVPVARLRVDEWMMC